MVVNVINRAVFVRVRVTSGVLLTVDILFVTTLLWIAAGPDVIAYARGNMRSPDQGDEITKSGTPPGPPTA